MSDPIRLYSSVAGVPIANTNSEKKAKKLLEASMAKLEAMLEEVIQIEESETSSKSGIPDLKSVLIEVRESVVKNPNDFMNLLHIIAPQIRSSSKKMEGQAESLVASFGSYLDSVSGISQETY